MILDVLLAREPHVAESGAILTAVERGRLVGLVGATTVTTIFYLAARALGARRARKHVDTLLNIFRVAPVTEDVLRAALSLSLADYEDAVLHEAAAAARADGLVTRDVGSFRRAKLPVYTPRELLAILGPGRAGPPDRAR